MFYLEVMKLVWKDLYKCSNYESLLLVEYFKQVFHIFYSYVCCHGSGLELVTKIEA